MAEFLDLDGLKYFKQKQDTYNEGKFIQDADLESLIGDKLTNVYRYKGTVPTKEQLPPTANPGDVYDVANGMNYAWNGSSWDALGDLVEVDAELTANTTNPVQGKTIYNELQKKAGTAEATDSLPGLMSAKDKAKLEKIQDEANKYVHPTVTIGAKNSGLYKIATDNMGHVTGAELVTAKDITDLGIPSENTTYDAIPTSEIDKLFN